MKFNKLILLTVLLLLMAGCMSTNTVYKTWMGTHDQLLSKVDGTRVVWSDGLWAFRLKPFEILTCTVDIDATFNDRQEVHYVIRETVNEGNRVKIQYFVVRTANDVIGLLRWHGLDVQMQGDVAHVSTIVQAPGAVPRPVGGGADREF